MIWNEILCLGDSITTGARDSQGRSFPAELASIMADKTGEFYYCHDEGVCGDTSSDVLRRVWRAASSHSDAQIATLFIGTNDIQIPITELVYKDNLRQIINVLKVHGMSIILCTLPQLGFTPLYLKNKEYIDKYNVIIRELALEYKCTVYDTAGTEKYYIDGVHYSHEGYKMLAKDLSNIILQK
tara:strand:- start:565 stop:1116 length:552 start_codon:yes stop_codon:yes gene_type:complete